MLRKLISFFSFSIIIISIKAQDTTRLTLQQALQIGVDSSKALHISTAKLQLAEAKYNQAVDATIPTVRLFAGYTRLSDIEEPKFLFLGATEPVSLFPVYVNNYQAGVSVSETIFSGFRLKYAKESQRLLRDAAKFDNEKEKSETEFAIVNAFFNLYKLIVSSKVVEENLIQVKQRLHETEVAQKNGLVTKNDVLRWQIQQSNLELTQLTIKNNIEVAEYNFNLMLGMNPDAAIAPDTNSVNEAVPEKPFADYMSEAMKNRSDLMSSELKTKSMYNAMRVAQNSYLPRIAINGEFLDARPNQRYIPPVDEFNTTWSIGASLNWDLVSLYSNRHNIDEARSLYRQSVEGHAILSDAISSEVHQNYLQFMEARQKKDVMERTLEQSAENFRLMDARFKNSLVLLSDLLEANNILLSSKINLAMAKADIQVAYYRLLKSTGSLNK
jgi:outer membrane protein TolC